MQKKSRGSNDLLHIDRAVIREFSNGIDRL